MAAMHVGRSEDEVGEKVDRCIADGLVKTGAGAALGVVFSLVLFKRKVWPIAFGIGTGTGMAISNCQHEFRRMFSPISIAKFENKGLESETVISPESIESETVDSS